LSFDFQTIVSDILEKQSLVSSPYHKAYHAYIVNWLTNRYKDKYPYVTLVGVGGTGVVLGFSDTSSSPLKCIKYPVSSFGTTGNFTPGHVIETEANRLTQLSHQNILHVDEVGSVPVVDNSDDFSLIDNEGEKIPFFVMPFIPCKNLADFLKEDRPIDQIVLLTILAQIAEALDYVHHHHLIHLDIKPENIFVDFTSPEIINAKLADFGSCKEISVGSTSKSIVLCTDGYIHPDLLNIIKQGNDSDARRFRNKVPKSIFDSRFDRYSFGATILDSVYLFLSNSVGRSVSPYMLRALQFISLKCADGYANHMATHPRRKYLAPPDLYNDLLSKKVSYASTTEVLRDIQAVISNGDGFTEQELLDSSQGIVCLPPRSFAPFPDRVQQTVDSTPVRRLSSISQLALVYHVYPGASYTRKEHTIGVFATAAVLLRHIIKDSRNPLGVLLLTLKWQRAILLSSLWHDISHIPLMHEFEDSIPELSQGYYFAKIMEKDFGSLAFQKEIDTILALWNLTRIDVVLVLGKKKNFDYRKWNLDEAQWDFLWELPERQLSASILNSAVDADKMDYLQRDALHVGVQYGHTVDLERLFRRATVALTVNTNKRDGTTITSFKCSLGFWSTGAAAAEAVIEARHNMFNQVYAHRTVRASRAMLNYIAWNWRCSIEEGKTYRPNSLFVRGSSLCPSGSILSQMRKQTQKQMQMDEIGSTAFAENRTLNVSEKRFEDKLRDNLPYLESSLIRWLAAQSGKDEAVLMAESLIQRELYKELFVIKIAKVQQLFDAIYSTKKDTENESKYEMNFRCNNWLGLIDFIEAKLKEYIQNEEKNKSVAISMEQLEKSKLPCLLVDFALPKTMRGQPILYLVSEEMRSGVGWEKVRKQNPSGGKETLSGMIVEKSRIYELFGGGVSESKWLTPVIRVFASKEIANVLRRHLHEETVIEWLNRYLQDGRAVVE